MTSDLGLAASLSAYGFPVIELDRSNPRRIEFVFENSQSLQAAVSSFWKKDLMVPGVTLMESIKQLKSRMYSS